MRVLFTNIAFLLLVVALGCSKVLGQFNVPIGQDLEGAARRSIRLSFFDASESNSRTQWRPPKAEAQVVQPTSNEEWPSQMTSNRTINATNLAVDSIQSPLLLESVAYALGRSKLERAWESQWDQDLACNMAAPHNVGFMNKLADLHDSPTAGLKSLKPPPSYRENRIPIYFGCMVYISVKHKFIYIRQPKSSSTSVMIGLVREFCHRHVREHEMTNNPIQRDCDGEELRKVPNARDVIEKEQWRDYFVFTVVRNPWARMLSAYNMFNDNFLHRTSPSNITQMEEPCGLPFEDFTEDSLNMADLCQSGRGCCPFWKKPGAENATSVGTGFTRIHISEQQHCVFLPDGTSMVDYIGTTETLDDDWVSIVGEIRRRQNGSYDDTYVAGLSNANPLTFYSSGANKSESAPKEEKSCAENKSRDVLDATALYNIAWQYALDVTRFGYFEGHGHPTGTVEQQETSDR